MEIGNDLPLLEKGVPTTTHWNNCARIVNALRKISFGPGLSGSLGPSGVYVGLQQAKPLPAYPYGDSHPWGITWAIDGASLSVKIWNGMYMYAGVLSASWWSAASEEGFSLPDKAFQEVVVGSGAWSENTGGLKRRVGIAHRLDTADNTSTIVASSTRSLLSTYETSPEPMQYITTPLYILEQSRSSTTAAFANTRIHMHFVGGIQVLQLYG